MKQDTFRFIAEKFAPTVRVVALLLVLCLLTPSAHALPQKLGDLDEDGLPTVLDLARLNAHIAGTQPLSAERALFADLNKDGFINDADRDELIKEILQTRTPEALPLATVRFTSPFTGESNVALTRETILQFTIPLSLGATLDTTRFHADFGGVKILSRVELSADRKKATLFYLEPFPASARPRVTFDSTGLTDLLGRPVDGDGDGQPGGILTFTYDTAPITAVPATGIIGHVYASERAPGGGDVPLAGALVRVVGSEALFTFTAPMAPSPSPRARPVLLCGSGPTHLPRQPFPRRRLLSLHRQSVGSPPRPRRQPRRRHRQNLSPPRASATPRCTRPRKATSGTLG